MTTSTQNKSFTLPSTSEKDTYVQALFTRIAPFYDRMNDLMSFGMHRQWKREAAKLLSLPASGRVLDICCGTGDLENTILDAYPDCEVVGLDFCHDMLAIARERFEGQNKAVEFIQGDALALPFENNTFDSIVIGYGLRNVANYQQCLQEMNRVVKPGGRVVILDMSHPNALMGTLSSVYRYYIMPLMGKFIGTDPDAYRYLSHSIEFYPNQKALTELMTQVGFKNVSFKNKLGGICALHWGEKAGA